MKTFGEPLVNPRWTVETGRRRKISATASAQGPGVLGSTPQRPGTFSGSRPSVCSPEPHPSKRQQPGKHGCNVLQARIIYLIHLDSRFMYIMFAMPLWVWGLGFGGLPSRLKFIDLAEEQHPNVAWTCGMRGQSQPSPSAWVAVPLRWKATISGSRAHTSPLRHCSACRSPKHRQLAIEAVGKRHRPGLQGVLAL